MLLTTNGAANDVPLKSRQKKIKYLYTICIVICMVYMHTYISYSPPIVAHYNGLMYNQRLISGTM